MLSVFVAAEEDAVALAETLAALVPAAVDGLVRRVTVITPAAPLNDLDRLIDESGAARAVAGGGPAAMWRSQFAGSGADWRLCLIAGMAPAGGWVDAVTRHMARQAGPAVFSVSSGCRSRFVAGAARVAGRIHPPSGLLAQGDWPSARRLALLPARLDDRRARR
ncbi:MAG: hypothetical protein BGP06_18045 [Rhizobiales bacterium 65-9]|nr:MAG: hypothetical protein BGP06_18045 [Rhizobiales bacterium 65-9]